MNVLLWISCRVIKWELCLILRVRFLISLATFYSGMCELEFRPVWLNGWVFVYELSGCRFESRCSHLNFRFRACFEQGVLEIQAIIECGFTLKHVHDMIRTYNQKNIPLHINLHFFVDVCITKHLSVKIIWVSHAVRCSKY